MASLSAVKCSSFLVAALLLLVAVAGSTAASPDPLGRRALLQDSRPSWFNNNRVQSGGNPGWGSARPQQRPGSSQGSASGQAGSSSQVTTRPTQDRNRKGDISALNSVLSQTKGYRNVPRQAIAPPTTGPASTLYQGLRRGGNAKANAQSLAEAFNTNSEAAATAVASAATEGGSSAAVAEAVAQTTVSHPGIAPGLLAKSAGLAVSKGQTSAFANTMADAFAVSKRGAYVPQFTRSVAGAVAQGGAPATLAVGEAIATAIAQGGDSKAAVAEATATAFCEGGSTAQSWASAYAVALSKDSSGCLVLNEAKAMAQARCGAGAAESISKAEATSMVLGFCGLLDFVPIDFNFSGGNGGSSSWAGH